MFRPRPRHSTRGHRWLLAVLFVLVIAMVPAIEGSAQIGGIRSNPTPRPTEAPERGFQAQPTAEPTREPQRTSPTQAPTQEPVDDVVANPTEAPQVAEPSSLTLNKGVCDDSAFDPYTATGLDAFLDACQSPDGEFEFNVSNGGPFDTTQATALGSLVMQVPTGVITITETIPEGWGDPAVFCWSSIYSTPSDAPFIGNGPQWDVAPGEDIECWWFNIAAGDEGHTIRVAKQVCPEGFAIPDDYWTLANGCQERLPNVGFALTTDAGTVEAATDANGEIEWTGVDLGASGQVQLAEEIPDGYGEPVVWCVNYPVEAADAQDFDFFPVTAINGLVTVSPEKAEPFIFHCTFFNAIADGGGPGDLVDPAQQEDGEGATVMVIKHRCPLGVPEDLTVAEYTELCTAMFEGIPFTLEHDGGSFPGETGEDGRVQWPGVPAGEIGIQEGIPEGYHDPLAFCVSFEGEQELESGEGVATGGLIELEIPEGATAAVCWVVNIPDPDLATSFVVNNWLCPIGYDEEAGDPGMDCIEPMDGVTFHLGDLVATTGQDAPGQAVFLDIPAGELALTEEMPAGIDHAFIGGCEVNSEAVPLLVALNDSPSIGIAVEPGDHWVCEWYNVPAVESRVVVNKRICPEGVDFVLDEDNPINDVITACPAEGDGIEFTLDHAGGSSTQAIVDGATWWDGVPNGPITITEHIPAGYEEPVWYCSTNPKGENGDVNPSGVWELGNAPGGVLDATLDQPYGEVFHCWVFNTTADDGDLIVTKWMCPPGYDVHAEGADPKADCTEPAGDGITFQFGQPGIGEEAKLQDTGDVIENGVLFSSLEPGDWRLVEFAPAGVESAFIGSCTVNGEAVPANPPIHEGFEWDIEIGAGEIIECDWYNVPDDGNSLTVLKWLCPAGFDLETGDAEAECTEPMGGVTFNLGEMEATTGDDQGVALFEDVPAGEHQLIEVMPDGIAYGWISHCSVPGSPLLIPIGGEQPPVVTLEFEEGTHWECHVYNVPDDDEENTIIIHKWYCPDGTGPDESLDWYEENCTDEHDGVDFRVASDLGLAVQETSGGQVQFDGMPPGTAGIQEFIPDGFGPPVVFCAPEDSLWQQYDAPAGHWEYDFLDDEVSEVLTCYVFNIPGEPPSITILKWTCPHGYDLLAWGADPMADCTEATNGVAFELRVEGNPALVESQTSGQLIEGGVVFDELEPDLYNIAELLPDGIVTAFILECTGHIMGVLQPYPLQFGNVLDDLDLDAGEHLTCYWFNVPEEDPDHGDLTLIKYTCATAEFVSEVDCQIEEDGRTFELVFWTGTWDLVDTETTDGFGQIQWAGIDPGEYWFGEHDGDWCHIASDNLYEDGPWVVVPEGQETVVHVYNCDDTPGKVPDIPEKYPNTGVPESGAPVDSLAAGAMGLGAIGALGVARALTPRRHPRAVPVMGERPAA